MDRTELDQNLQTKSGRKTGTRPPDLLKNKHTVLEGLGHEHFHFILSLIRTQQ